MGDLARCWFVIVHSVIAIPVCSWLYAAEDIGVFGIYALIHAVLLGAALERRAATNPRDRRPDERQQR